MGRIPTVAFSTREHAVLILNAADVRQALPMTLAVEAMKQAFAAFSDGKAFVPPRIHLPIAPHAGVSLIMPSFVDAASTAEQALAVKVVSLFDGNQARGLARLQAAVVVLEPDTGRPIALLDGAMLTAIRTAAASGAATDLLARRDCRTLALFGVGVQLRASGSDARCGPSTRFASSAARQAKSPSSSSAARVLDPSGTRIIVAESPQQALADADIVCCTTTSKTPIFDNADLKPGVHLNAVGSYTPQARSAAGDGASRTGRGR